MSALRRSDARLYMWYGRSMWTGDHTEKVEAALIAAALKELAYLEQFGRSLLLGTRSSHHSKNLERYLHIASSLVSNNSALRHFRIRHPDPQPNTSSCHVYPVENYGPAEPCSIGNTPRSYPRFSSLVYQKYDDLVSQTLIPRRRWRTWTSWTSPITMYCRIPCPCSSAAFSTKPVLYGRMGYALKTYADRGNRDMWEAYGRRCADAFDLEDLRKTKELSEVADEN